MRVDSIALGIMHSHLLPVSQLWLFDDDLARRRYQMYK